MKKIVLLFLLAFVCFNIQAQVVTNDQMSLLTKRTADWCPLCGTYGWALTTQLKPQAAQNNLLMWNVHHSGGLATETSKAMAANFGGVGQPLFFFNGDNEDLDVTSSNIDEKVDEIIASAELWKNLGSSVGMGSEATIDQNNKVSVKTKIKFNEPADIGEYYIGTYLVKKNLVWTQASVGPNAVHHAVLDKAFSSAFFGSAVAKAPIAVDAEYSDNVTLSDVKLHNNKLEDTKVFIVIWNKNAAGKYIYVNAREVNLVLSNTSSVSDSDLNFDFDFTVSKNEILVKQHAEYKAKITVLDAQGREVPLTIHEVDPLTKILNLNQMTNGLHFLHIDYGQGSKTKKFVYIND